MSPNSKNKHNTFKLFGIPKLPKKSLFVLIPFLLSLVMSGVVSFISVVKNLGMSIELFTLWFPTWMTSWGIAFPVVLIVNPIVQRIALSMVKKDE